VTLSAFGRSVARPAVEWIQPESSDKPIRLGWANSERIAAGRVNTSGRPSPAIRVPIIESIGSTVLERVRESRSCRPATSQDNLGEDDLSCSPAWCLEIYVPDYGPEDWAIDYPHPQDELAVDYGERASAPEL